MNNVLYHHKHSRIFSCAWIKTLIFFAMATMFMESQRAFSGGHSMQDFIPVILAIDFPGNQNQYTKNLLNFTNLFIILSRFTLWARTIIFRNINDDIPAAHISTTVSHPRNIEQDIRVHISDHQNPVFWDEQLLTQSFQDWSSVFYIHNILNISKNTNIFKNLEYVLL